MNRFIPAQTVEPNTPSVFRQAAHEGCLAAPSVQLQKQEAERVFEAGVQWFLAVSAAA